MIHDLSLNSVISKHLPCDVSVTVLAAVLQQAEKSEQFGFALAGSSTYYKQNTALPLCFQSIY